MVIFRNREEAGQLLAESLKDLKSKKQTAVLAIPRGGVVVGAILAKQLQLPLDVIITRKIGTPLNPELAIGATSSEGGTLWDEDLIAKLQIDERHRKEEEHRQVKEAKRREKLFRGDRLPLDVTGKTVVLTDDGVATGLTIEAAIHAILGKNAAEVVLAIPVAPLEVVTRLQAEVRRVEILTTPEPFHAVGEFYQNFEQVTDDQVKKFLA